jgi:ribonuclease HI
LEWALEHDVEELEVFTDSQLLERQIKGLWKVKHPNLKGLHLEIRDLIAKLGKFRISHVRRENNKDADRLANEALDDSAGI